MRDRALAPAFCSWRLTSDGQEWLWRRRRAAGTWAGGHGEPFAPPVLAICWDLCPQGTREASSAPTATGEGSSPGQAGLPAGGRGGHAAARPDPRATGRVRARNPGAPAPAPGECGPELGCGAGGARHGRLQGCTHVGCAGCALVPVDAVPVCTRLCSCVCVCPCQCAYVGVFVHPRLHVHECVLVSARLCVQACVRWSVPESWWVRVYPCGYVCTLVCVRAGQGARGPVELCLVGAASGKRGRGSRLSSFQPNSLLKRLLGFLSLQWNWDSGHYADLLSLACFLQR